MSTTHSQQILSSRLLMMDKKVISVWVQIRTSNNLHTTNSTQKKKNKKKKKKNGNF